MIDVAAVQEFFGAIFGPIWSPRWALIWTLADKKSHWATTAEAAAGIASRVGADSDVYVGACLRPEKSPRLFGETKRGGKTDAAALHALWLDIDGRSPHRLPPERNESLPPGLDECWEIVEAVGLRSSMVIDSGYGLQAWFRLSAPILLDTPERWREAAQLSEAFTRRAQRLARGLGWELDSAHSLDHVMRVPGTWNRKGEPRLVRVVDTSTAAHGQAEIEELCMDELQAVIKRDMEGKKDAAFEVGAITIRADAEPPSDKLLAATENDPAFKRTWNRKRQDLKEQSQSTYDRALACRAVSFGWNDQEIANLLIAHRRAGGGKRLDEKPKDYIQKEISSAREFMSKHAGQADQDDTIEIMEAVEKGPEQIVRVVRKKLGIPVLGLLQRGRRPAHYYLAVQGCGEVYIGLRKQALSVDEVRGVLWEATGKVIPSSVKRQSWFRIMEALSRVKKIDEMEEGDRPSETMQWVHLYMDELEQPPDRAAIIDEEKKRFRLAFLGKKPFIDSERGSLHVNTWGLKRFLKTSLDVSIADSDLRARLSEAGFCSEKVSVRKETEVYRRSYWRYQLHGSNNGNGGGNTANAWGSVTEDFENIQALIPEIESSDICNTKN